MAIHRDISSDLRGAVARVAMAAISEARGQQTAPNGTVSVRNADGTRTVIGAGAGTDGTGAPVGVRQFVGDTTPPGRPTGLSWSSSAGDVTARWDGTLEGGVPADLDYVELRAGDEVVGRLRRAGSCSMRAKAGTELSCVAVAVDVSGNASAESEATAVTVRDLVAEASVDASKALAGNKTYETWQQGFLQLFKAVQDNKPFIMNVYHSVSREQVENYLYKVTYDLLEGVVEEQAQGMSVRDEDKAFIATVYKYAFVGLMLDWIKNDMKGDSQLLVDRLELVIHGNVRAALERLRIDKA